MDRASDALAARMGPHAGATPTPGAAAAAVSLCALLTCFNRRALTLHALAALQVAARKAGVELHAVLVDDGSTDGTADAVRAQHPWTQVVRAEGNLYWCRGMHRAFEAALPQPHHFYLWLNDDTLLDPDALQRLLATHAALKAAAPERPCIVVGSTRDRDTGLTTYGGERRAGWWPTRFAKVEPLAHEPLRVDTFDGNIVLVEHAAAQRAGNLDAQFEHAMGDLDYGLRAKRSGVDLWLAPGTHGLCNDNSVDGTYLDPRLPLRRRWKLMLTRKGLPPRSWLHFNRQHAGWLWPLTFSWPYLRLLLQGLGAPPQRGGRA